MVRVLVTRPQPSAARTAAKLQLLGHQPLLLPLARALHDSLATLDGFGQRPDAIAVTSAEAIRVLADLGDRLQPHLRTPLFAVGSSTAEAARTLGFDAVVTGPGTGQGLAKLVLEKLDASLLYLTGTPRASAFEEAIVMAGRRITICECYRMINIDHPRETLETLFVHNQPEAVLLYSAESARRFFNLDGLKQSPACLEGMRFLCISDAVARTVPASFGAMVSISPNPDEASLLSLL